MTTMNTGHFDPLQWWSHGTEKFPLLSDIARRIYCIRGVHNTGIPMGRMGIPWEWEAYTEFMGMGTTLGMVDRKWNRNGNSSVEEIPISHANHIFHCFFNGLA